MDGGRLRRFGARRDNAREAGPERERDELAPEARAASNRRRDVSNGYN
jgi:hypothetical protein